MDGTTNFQNVGDGTARISGDMIFSTVSGLCDESVSLHSEGSNIRQLDLAQVNHVDSSGLALLLEWQSAAVQDGHELEILNAPGDLVILARLCEAQGLLKMSERDDKNPSK